MFSKPGGLEVGSFASSEGEFKGYNGVGRLHMLDVAFRKLHLLDLLTDILVS